MSPHFCCCLPIRFGAFIISLVQFSLNGLVAAALWFVIANNKTSHLLDNKSLLRDTIASAVLDSITAVVAFIAFIGAIRNRSSYIYPYAYVVTLLVMSKFTVACLQIIFLFTEPSSNIISSCIGGKTNDQDLVNFCHKELGWVKGILIAALVLPVVVESYALWIIYQYGVKLENKEEEVSWNKSLPMNPTYTSAPLYDQGGRGSEEALTTPKSYPYTDQAHSFGNQGNV